MPTPQAADMNVWIAAGVQHAVLARTLPALRHELAGSVSVLRMGVAVVRRKLDNTTNLMEREALQERVASLDAHITDFSADLRRLRHWDKPTNETLALQELLQEVWELARPYLALRNIQLTELEAAPGRWPASSHPPQPLMYMLLAGIYHLAEGNGHAPQRISIVPHENDRVSLHAEGVAEPHAMPESDARGPNPLIPPPIDHAGLQCLATHLRVPITFKSDQSIDFPLSAMPVSPPG